LPKSADHCELGVAAIGYVRFTNSTENMAVFTYSLILAVVGFLGQAALGAAGTCPLSDDVVWNLTTGGKSIGSCSIRVGDSRHYCDLYVYAGGKGYPQQSGGDTGCVKAPDFPKHMSTCFYGIDPRFRFLGTVFLADMCTESGKHNAVAMLCHALVRGLCF
jgi:hypothetical protein